MFNKEIKLLDIKVSLIIICNDNQYTYLFLMQNILWIILTRTYLSYFEYFDTFTFNMYCTYLPNYLI